MSLDALDIDHVLPQSWYAYWPLADGSDVSEQEALAASLQRFATTELDAKTTSIINREQHIPRIGNLTMVHYGVNRSLQNHAFELKRQAFFDHSHLQLNRALTKPAIWDEAAIQARAEALFEFARELWRGPL